mgnify:FL=1
MAFKKLVPEFKDRWIKALRNGEYTQWRGNLRYGNSFCCLGVACDISALGRWSGEEFKCADGEFSLISVPRLVREAINLDMSVNYSLAKKNDSGKWDFKRIARWISRYL